MTLEDRVKAMERPEGDMWKYHNQALKNPEYQMEGMMSCLKEEMMMNMPVAPDNEYPEREQREEPLNKRQWDTIQQLKAQVLFLSGKINKMRANASKRKPIDTNKLNILYKGIEGSNGKSC